MESILGIPTIVIIGIYEACMAIYSYVWLCTYDYVYEVRVRDV